MRNTHNAPRPPLPSAHQLIPAEKQWLFAAVFALVYAALLAISCYIWRIGYEYGAHRHTDIEVSLQFWALGIPFGLGTYLFRRRTGDRYVRQTIAFSLLCLPGAVLLAVAYAFCRGVIPGLTVLMMPSVLANGGMMFGEVHNVFTQKRSERINAGTNSSGGWDRTPE